MTCNFATCDECVQGGCCNSNSLVDRYDPNTNTWTSRASMSVIRVAHGLFGVGDYLYAIVRQHGSRRYAPRSTNAPHTTPCVCVSVVWIGHSHADFRRTARPTQRFMVCTCQHAVRPGDASLWRLPHCRIHGGHLHLRMLPGPMPRTRTVCSTFAAVLLAHAPSCVRPSASQGGWSDSSPAWSGPILKYNTTANQWQTITTSLPFTNARYYDPTVILVPA